VNIITYTPNSPEDILASALFQQNIIKIPFRMVSSTPAVKESTINTQTQTSHQQPAFLNRANLNTRMQIGEGTTFLPGKKDPSVAKLIDHVLEHGYVILPSIFTKTEVDNANAELERLEASESGPASKGGRNAFEGFQTKRVYSLPDKSRAFDCFPIHDTILKLNDYFLQPSYLLSSFHTVDIGPGEKPQGIHTDDGLIPLPRPRPLMGIVSKELPELDDY
jgi:hypothetical protein